MLIGVDPHKSMNAVAAIDENGEILNHTAFPANRGRLQALERWSKRFPKRRWAVEGAAGIGRPVAQKLVGAGEEVVDVPPKLSAKVRVLSVGNARKSRFGRFVPSERRQRTRKSRTIASKTPADSHLLFCW